MFFLIKLKSNKSLNILGVQNYTLYAFFCQAYECKYKLFTISTVFPFS